MNRAVVGVGSNIDPERNIGLAHESIARAHRLTARSALTRTKPVGFSDQPDFLNGALIVETGMTQERFVADLHRIESELGRMRTANRNGPRTIDLDLVAWNGEIVDPDYHTREFLRNAIREVAPEIAAANPG